MDAIKQIIWQWLQNQWIQSDLASWLAVGLAIMAVFYALRKPAHHTELNFTNLHFDDDGGPITLEVELDTYSHAPRLVAKVRLKMDGVDYPLKLEQPIKMPTNSNFSVLNAIPLRFRGQYVKSETPPATALIDVKAKFSDGSNARLRKKLYLESTNSNKPKSDKENSRT